MPDQIPPNFQHLQLALHHKGKSKSVGGGGGGNKSPATIRNLNDRHNHGRKVQLSLQRLRAMWKRLEETRAEQSLPPLPPSIPLFIQADPLWLDLDVLENMGLELAMECANGYMLCASKNTDLTELQEAIDQFVRGKNRRDAVARLYVIETDNIERRKRVVGSSLQRALNASTARDPISALAVLSTHGVRKVPEKPRETGDRLKDYSAYVGWKGKVAAALQNWIIRFAERVTAFAALVVDSGGLLIDRSDVSLFFAGKPTHLLALITLTKAQIGDLEVALSTTCTVINTYQESDGTEKFLARFAFGGLLALPPEPQREGFPDQGAYEHAWRSWVEQSSHVRADDWVKRVSDFRHDLEVAINSLDGTVHTLAGDDIDHLQPPDQLTLTITAPSEQIATLCENHPYIVRMDVLPRLATAPITPPHGDPDVPAMLPPAVSDPAVCVIDSGVQVDHPIIGPSVDKLHAIQIGFGSSALATDVNGHGTAVAGAICFPYGMQLGVPTQSHVWIQSIRVLDAMNELPVNASLEMLTWRCVRRAARDWGTKIFNLSINYQDPIDISDDALTDSWSAHLDWISAFEDVVIITSVGNIPPNVFRTQRENQRLGQLPEYPDTMGRDACRLAPPALSWNAIVVGSVAPETIPVSGRPRIAQPLGPSPFSRGGPGLWGCVKPDLVEVAGDWVENANSLAAPLEDPGLMIPLPQRLASNDGLAKGGSIGTSFAAPKVARVAAEVLRSLPDASPLLIRTLVLHSAQWPSWMDSVTDEKKGKWLNHIGFGLPAIDRASENDQFRVTYVTTGRDRIGAGQIAVWKIPIHPELRRNHSVKIRFDVTACCTALPHPTRRERSYGSLWVDWKASGRSQDFDAFVSKWAHDVNAAEDAEKGARLQWTLGARREKEGRLDGITGCTGSIHKDWTEILAGDLPPDAFGIAIRGHAGWERHPEASVPYALAVTFTVVGQEIPIYALQVEAQAEVRTQVRVEV